MKLYKKQLGGRLYKKPCGCNMTDDGMDTDVFKSLPMMKMNKIYSQCGIKQNTPYNDTVKIIIKSTAKDKGMRLVDFITKILGHEI
jgi:hypothetical protein